MRNCVQGLHDFLRAYFHMKSGDWPGNEPFPLAAWTADELAKMPTYYIMDIDQTMAETVAPDMPTPDHIARCQWLPDEELAVYAEEFGRTGFQGGLQWYRCAQAPSLQSELLLFAGRHIDVPAGFIAGARRLGRLPGTAELSKACREQLCTDFRALHLLEGRDTGSNKNAAMGSPPRSWISSAPDILPFLLHRPSSAGHRRSAAAAARRRRDRCRIGGCQVNPATWGRSSWTRGGTAL